MSVTEHGLHLDRGVKVVVYLYFAAGYGSYYRQGECNAWQWDCKHAQMMLGGVQV